MNHKTSYNVRKSEADTHNNGDLVRSNGELDEDIELAGILGRLTTREAREVHLRTSRHRAYLTKMVVPQVAVGLLAAAEEYPSNTLDFLADHLIRCCTMTRI